MAVHSPPHHLEAEQLKLAAEHFPLPCSLLERVQERFADPAAAATGVQALDPEEVVSYLSAQEDLTLTPMQSILAQTEAIGDPALPAPFQVAILNWLGAAFDEWERNFPLEAPIAGELRRLKPLAAVLAIADPDFLVPGKHPLHQLLDSLHLAAVGWQERLGRVGQATRRRLEAAVEAALSLGDSAERKAALEELASEVTAATDRDVARAGRLAQRMIETEQGRVRTVQARLQATAMINSALATYLAPASIGHFLKGPWFDSAQLLLLKFGADSEQWRLMCTTTETLLESLQITHTEDPRQRQQLFEMATQLPRELKRWTMSLHHDTDAVNDAVGVVEFAHLSILRKKPLELERIEPLPVAGDESAATPTALPPDVEAGQWFSLRLGEGEPVRAKLVLRMDEAGQLLFVNQAGIKCLQCSAAEFASLLQEDKVRLLQSGAAFSRSLALVAGIDTTEGLDSLLGAEAARARREEEERERAARQREEQQQAERERLRREQEAAQAMQRALDAAEREQPADLGRHDIHLSMGAWLGFHDGDTPLLAKLAVHDREQNTYIFVNRSGIKLRQLSREQLIDLLDRGLAEVLETRSSFRDEISRARKRSEP